MHNKYTKIGQLRNAIKEAKRIGETSILYEGTIKLHGTNAGIRISKDGVTAQSRNRDLDIHNDNAGFANWLNDIPRNDILNLIPVELEGGGEYIIYGEWCGEGVQKGVGISDIGKKVFVVFDVKLDGKYLGSEDVCLFRNKNLDILNIYDFEVYSLVLNVNNPEQFQHGLTKLVDKVEGECPVAKQLGVNKGVGEGLVWKPVREDLANNTDLWFKTKGQKHSVSKVKTVAPVDIERMSSIRQFLDYSLTDHRLNQGLDYLVEMGEELTLKNTGKFLSWVVKDIWEEESDVIKQNNFTRKEINSKIGNTAREWYFFKLNN